MTGVHTITRTGLALLALAGGVQAQTDSAADGLLLRIGGDAVVSAAEHFDAVIVLDGDATISGLADFILVAGGVARLQGATAKQVLVANGELRLEGNSEVTGDVELFRSTLHRDEGTVILGEVRETPVQYALKGAWFFGAFLLLGVAFAVVGAGLVATAVAHDGTRRVGRVLVERLPATLLAAAVLWLGLPLIAVGLMPTIVAVPMGLGLFIFVLPALGFVGFVLAGIALGNAVLHSLRPVGNRPSPYWASALGITLLLAGGLMPIIGALIAPLAGAIGSGALLVALWDRAMNLRSARANEALSPV